MAFYKPVNAGRFAAGGAVMDSLSMATNRICRICAVAALAGLACRAGRGVSMARIDAELRAMEKAVVERTLISLFPDDEGWLILPGADQTRDSSFAQWLGSYRIVAPDSVSPDEWRRFVRGSPSVELLEVSGALTTPQRVSPVGFRGLRVRFAVGGVESSVLILDPRGMRWVLWFETATTACDGIWSEALDSLGSSVTRYLLHGGPEPAHPAIPPDAWLYPPAPSPSIDAVSLWDAASRSAIPKIGSDDVSLPIVPDLTLARRLSSLSPSELLQNQEPFFLQRRLEQMVGLEPVNPWRDGGVIGHEGEYVWAMSSLGQVRAVGVEIGVDQNPGPCVGPSVLFYGRPVLAAGSLRIDAEGGAVVDAYAGEYGLSPFSSSSVDLSHHAGRRLLPRLGHLLSALPGPETGVAWPSLQTVPSAPWPCWQPRETGG